MRSITIRNSFSTIYILGHHIIIFIKRWNKYICNVCFYLIYEIHQRHTTFKCFYLKLIYCVFISAYTILNDENRVESERRVMTNRRKWPIKYENIFSIRWINDLKEKITEFDNECRLAHSCFPRTRNYQTYWNYHILVFHV